MYRRITIFILTVIAAMSLSAARRYLAVTTTGQTKGCFLVTDETKITFEDGMMKVTSPDDNFSFFLPKVSNYYYTDEFFSNVDDVTLPPVISLRDGRLEVEGVAEGERVVIASVGGEILYSATATGSSVSLPVSDHFGRIIVVGIGDKSLKLMVK